MKEHNKECGTQNRGCAPDCPKDISERQAQVNVAKEEWEGFKKYLLATQTEFEERNGLDHCKNCGVNFKGVVRVLEGILMTTRQEAIAGERKRAANIVRDMSTCLMDGFDEARCITERQEAISKILTPESK